MNILYIYIYIEKLEMILLLPPLHNWPPSYWHRESFFQIHVRLPVQMCNHTVSFRLQVRHSKIERKLHFLVRVIEPCKKACPCLPLRFHALWTIQLRANAAVLRNTWSLSCAATSTLHQNVPSKKVNQRWQQSQIGHMFSYETSCWNELLQRFSLLVCSTFCSVEILQWSQQTCYFF